MFFNSKIFANAMYSIDLEGQFYLQSMFIRMTDRMLFWVTIFTFVVVASLGCKFVYLRKTNEEKSKFRLQIWRHNVLRNN